VVGRGCRIFVYLGDGFAGGEPPMVVVHGRLIVLMGVLLEVLRLRGILGCRLFKDVEGLSQVRLSLELVMEEEF
jgi:hypothetical protein